MRTELEQGLLNGRLECPNSKCKAQIGRYAWQGMRCSCGKWICPAFSLHKGRVDEIMKKDVGGLLGSQQQGADLVGGVEKFDLSSSDVPSNAEERIAATGIRLPPGMKIENL
jgi:dual specificity phosphatase 12